MNFQKQTRGILITFIISVMSATFWFPGLLGSLLTGQETLQRLVSILYGSSLIALIVQVVGLFIREKLYRGLHPLNFTSKVILSLVLLWVIAQFSLWFLFVIMMSQF